MSDITAEALLAADEPAPVEIVEGDGRSPFVVLCDHAGPRLPRALGTLGLSTEALASHIAWDIGAAGVARRLAAALGAFLACQRYSRLVIDANRPLEAPDSIAMLSERTAIPGNENVTPQAAASRARAFFHPYHDRIRLELERRRRENQPAVLVAVHSFTPTFLGQSRPWHIGVLYGRDGRLAQPLLGLLRADGDLVVGCNQPYDVSDLTDYTIVEHGERRGLAHVELELRQDLIASDAEQRAWASRLARLLPLAWQAVGAQ